MALNHNNPPENIGGFENKNLTDRAIKGYAIISKGDIPQTVNEEVFLVPSQSSNKKYRVVVRNSYSCSCPDHKYRKVKCKHIYAVEFLLKMREKFTNNLEFGNELTDEMMCVYCKSKNIKENGNRKTKSRLKQRYYCKDCKRTFITDKEFERIKADPKLITLAMDLYYKGNSLRDISDTFHQFYGLEISHETIRNWITRFTKAMNEYVDTYTVKPTKVWNVDETALHKSWIWNVLDKESRFLIALQVTDSRHMSENDNVFTRSKEIAREHPKLITSDSFRGYERVVEKVYPKTKYEGFIGLQNRINNNRVERLHGNIKERYKVMRGLKTVKTAQEIMDGFRVYYNFIRPHQALNGLTPAQAIGLDLKLGQNRWLSLLKKSLNVEK